jgi:hypothetical protein
LGAIVVLCVWMYARDVGAVPMPPEQARAQVAADTILTRLTPSPGCTTRCSATLISRVTPGIWRVQLNAPSWQRCFLIDLNEFSQSPQHGLTGVQSAQCR